MLFRSKPQGKHTKYVDLLFTAYNAVDDAMKLVSPRSSAFSYLNEMEITLRDMLQYSGAFDEQYDDEQ